MKKNKSVRKNNFTEDIKSSENSEITSDEMHGFPIVGIGASAGGLAAFEAFFSAIPADSDPGMAFVLVQHLAPDHKSLLSDLISRYTSMKVFEVNDGMVVKPNCIYIIPPGRDMAFVNGTLQLLEPIEPRGQRLPVDFFFRSLAQDLHERAIGVVLSGTGSDGTLGVRAIKGEGGMVIAQIPASTEYDGMPRSALSTGLVDYELPPAEMAEKILAYVKHAFGKFSNHISVSEPSMENSLKKIFVLLRSQTGHDFSQYKPTTITRRIERRMAVNQIDLMDGYVRFMQHKPDEVESLFRDLLIGVTSFFRDPEAFQVLEKQVIPKIFHEKTAGASIRVWLPGCSTGEEAYSIAILIQEYMETLKQSYMVQIFATDIDRRSIAVARSGLYPASISADITPERLARYFIPGTDGSSYRIHKVIRDMLIFSEQNLIKEPPFSKLDLISCRNLLIYMGVDLQKRVIPLFHYSLRPDGFLFLGTSETVGEFGDLFDTVDRKQKIFRRRDNIHSTSRFSYGKFLPSESGYDRSVTQNIFKRNVHSKPPLREITEQTLLQQIAPAGALINENGDILYLHGRTGMYLEPAQGESGINNILKMARDGLRQELTAALHNAALRKEIIRSGGIRVKTNGHFTLVNLTVRPVETKHETMTDIPLYLVVLEEAPVPAADGEAGNLPIFAQFAGEDDRIAELKHELKIKEEYLQTANEELETSNEELKSSNEEMQSVNEELQSTNEELETSKEELQSVNEELATVNTELQTKVCDLSRANNDMNNLLAGTGIGTIFVDHSLRILRFTPAITQFINLIPGDLGRPVGHIVSNLTGYTSLLSDTQEVLNTLKTKEIQVQTTEGRWYIMRILPYRTLENVIEGAVITFSEITELKLAQEALSNANKDLLRLAVVVRDSHDAITVHDLEGRITSWNPGAARMYGWSESEALKLNVRQLIPEKLQSEALAMEQKLSRSETIEPYITKRITRDGRIINISMISTALLDDTGEMYAVSTTERLVSGQ